MDVVVVAVFVARVKTSRSTNHGVYGTSKLSQSQLSLLLPDAELEIAFESACTCACEFALVLVALVFASLLSSMLEGPLIRAAKAAGPAVAAA